MACYGLGRHQSQTMITITDSAIGRLKEILVEENNPALKLRVFVQGGGCSGLKYGVTLDETQEEDDWDLEFNGVNVLVDSSSGQYLQDAIVDFKQDLNGASFVISNPQAQTTCGCGSSFSI